MSRSETGMSVNVASRQAKKKSPAEAGLELQERCRHFDFVSPWMSCFAPSTVWRQAANGAPMLVISKTPSRARAITIRMSAAPFCCCPCANSRRLRSVPALRRLRNSGHIQLIVGGALGLRFGRAVPQARLEPSVCLSPRVDLLALRTGHPVEPYGASFPSCRISG